MLKTKLKAFSIHLSVSVLVMLIFMGLMFFVWYPVPYFSINSGWSVLRIMLGVDIIMGPLLTLIVFNHKKSALKLKLDLSVIVLLQLAAFSYGSTIIYQHRPAFVVFGTDRFTVVTAADVEFDKINYPELQRRHGIGPRLAVIEPPKDQKIRNQLLMEVLLEGKKDLEFRAEYYAPYQLDLAHLRSRSVDIQTIASLDPNAKKAIEEFVDSKGGHNEDFFFFPLLGANESILIVLSSQDGMPVGSIPIHPWLSDYQDSP
ncbi:MAG: TfpX/TfpZ family type IV pilin accessory protein [Candidatus Thiodiazotropha sp. L084R]